jgi:hypothetical protein
MDYKFKIKSYGYGELAQMYFPSISKKSASWQLTLWINQSKTLKESLINSGHKKRQRLLTPNQVQLIVGEFGEP